MPGAIHVYGFGAGGVNVVKSPLELADDEVTQAQNAELIPDANVGGQAVLSKRGGLAVLNASPLAGSIQGIWGVPLLTTYTRTLYFARGSANSNTWATTTDGTTFTPVATPLAHALQSDWSDEDGKKNAHRLVAFKTYLFYPGNNYTKSTDQPEITTWDGTTSILVERIPTGPSANAVAYTVTDMLVANGVVYVAVHDPGGAGTNLAGRVLRYDPITGQLTQVLNAFGNETGNVTVGYPAALCWYQNQLWVGLNNGATTDGIGKVVRAYPDVDSTWTTDVSNLTSSVCSIAAYNGNLYVGTQSSVAANAKVYKRSATAGTYAASFTSGGGTSGNGFCGNLIVYSSNLYATDYHDTGPVALIKKWDDSSWSTDRDVTATDTAIASNFPTNAILYGSDLYIVWRAATASGTTAIINRLTGGSWSKATTGNYNGQAAVLVTRA